MIRKTVNELAFLNRLTNFLDQSSSTVPGAGTVDEELENINKIWVLEFR